VKSNFLKTSFLQPKFTRMFLFLCIWANTIKFTHFWIRANEAQKKHEIGNFIKN